MRNQSWRWLLLVAFVLAVLNLLTNGWQFGYHGGALFLLSNVISMFLAVAAMVWSLVELVAAERNNQPVRNATYVITWIVALVIVVAVDLWTLTALRGM